MEKRFEKQTAVITGGADGLGKSIALQLAREGARVFLFDMNRGTLDKACADFAHAGLKAEGVEVDISDEGSVRRGFDKVAVGGSLEVVVNSAGIVGPNGKKIVDVPVEGFDKVVAVNLRGSFLVAQNALRLMAPKNYGRILLIASIAGKEGNAGMCSYSASKAGVIGLVKAIGKEYAETGITINALAPAVIRTALVDGMDPAQVKYMTDKIPMKRCGTLEEVAALSCFIVSREASFSTAFTFDISGGRAVY